MNDLTEQEFRDLSALLYEHTGIFLPEEKRIFLTARLGKRMNELGLRSYRDYIKVLRNSTEESQVFINHMTTNKTDWWREPAHFDFLVQWWKSQQRDRSLMVWSAACSSGEEVYTLSMVLKDAGIDARILGTDIDTVVLNKAVTGHYSKDVIREQVNPSMQAKYFRTIDKADQLEVNSVAREHVKFRQFNLVKDEISVPIQFDAIFLRNVLIYFRGETIRHVIEKLQRYLRPDGLLFIGHSESIQGHAENMRLVGNACYKKCA